MVFDRDVVIFFGKVREMPRSKRPGIYWARWYPLSDLETAQDLILGRRKKTLAVFDWRFALDYHRRWTTRPESRPHGRRARYL